MKYIGINEASELTGKSTRTINKRVGSLRFRDGERGKKEYESPAMLEAIILGETESGDGNFVSTGEAQRLLTIARKNEIELNMEVTRKERIPISIIDDVNREVMMNVAAMIKAHVGKTLDEQLVNDILAEWRSVDDKLAEVIKRA